MKKPPVVLRLLIGVVGVLAVAFNAALMLSDRAPRILDRLTGAVARRLSERIDTGGRARGALDTAPLKSDAIVHIGLWAVAIIFVGLAIWSWRGLFVGAIAVFATSAIIEFGQGRYSSTRTVEAEDLVSNAVGVVGGSVVVSSLYGLWHLGAVAAGRRR